MRKANSVRRAELYEAVLSLRNIEDCVNFFNDLCSFTELRAMEQRYQVAVMLNQGKIYSEIFDETGASSATISRVNRSLKFGAGGYDAIFNPPL